MNELAAVQQLSQQLRTYATQAQIDQALHKPLIILSAPRSGSTLLFEYLTRLPQTSWIGSESHKVFRNFPHLRAENQSLDSASLNETHANPQCIQLFRDNMACLLRDVSQQSFLQNPKLFLQRPTQFIEKTPRNALNIPFLDQVFSDARYIFLHRAPQPNIASIIEAWTLGLDTGRFMTFPELPGWDRPGWCFLLPPGWRELVGCSLAEIAAFQWQQSNQTIVQNLAKLPTEKYCTVSYEDLLANPQSEIDRLLNFAEIDSHSKSHMQFANKLSNTTLTQPATDKWQRHKAQIDPLLASLEATCQAIEKFTTR
ncbi:sulfotransferase [Porticoccaceae bacterium]|nr:sulfotransferase [Porticoccaceae bacterium]